MARPQSWPGVADTIPGYICCANHSRFESSNNDGPFYSVLKRAAPAFSRIRGGFMIPAPRARHVTPLSGTQRQDCRRYWCYLLGPGPLDLGFVAALKCCLP